VTSKLSTAVGAAAAGVHPDKAAAAPIISHGTFLARDEIADAADPPGHVGMYLGQGMVIQAPQAGEDVEITPFKAYWRQDVVAMRRVV